MKFKIVFHLICTFFAFHIASAMTDLKMKPIQNPEDKHRFYSVFDEILYLPHFHLTSENLNKYATKVSDRLFRVPLSILTEEFGFKKGEVISVFDFEAESMFQYKVKDFVYILLFEVSNRDYFSSASMILSDDPKVHERLAKTFRKRDRFTGLAYRGSERKMKSFNIDWIPVKDVSKNDPLFSTAELKFRNLPFIKEGKLYQYNVYIYPIENQKEFLNRFRFFLKKPDGTFHGFPRDSYILDKKKENMKFYEMFEGTKVLKMFDDNSGKSSSTLYFILCSPNSLELIELGGDYDPVL